MNWGFKKEVYQREIFDGSFWVVKNKEELKSIHFQLQQRGKNRKVAVFNYLLLHKTVDLLGSVCVCGWIKDWVIKSKMSRGGPASQRKKLAILAGSSMKGPGWRTLDSARTMIELLRKYWRSCQRKLVRMYKVSRS